MMASGPSIARHKFLDKTTSAELLDRLFADEATIQTTPRAAPSPG
jgi:hypothetical protein